MFRIWTLTYWFNRFDNWASASIQIFLVIGTAKLASLMEANPSFSHSRIDIIFTAHPKIWTVSLTLILFFSLFGWVTLLRRYRFITSIPSSRIASAAQGYVAICGKGKALGGLPLVRNCLWYKIITEQRSEWGRTVEESDASFILDDHGALCLVDIEGAEIESIHKYVEREKDLYRTYYTLEQGDSIYAVGDFHTTHNLDTCTDEHAEIGDVLARWKQNPAELKRRFDLNKDGMIDEQEWELVRLAAKKQAAKDREERLNAPALNMLKQPKDGKPYFITNLNPKKQAKQYLIWAGFHLVMFFGALATLSWILASSALTN